MTKAQAATAPRSSSASDLKKMANAIRALSMDAVEKANSGHPGMPMGMADVATVLYAKFLKFDPKNPEWPDRDRFVLLAVQVHATKKNIQDIIIIIRSILFYIETVLL